MDHNHCPILSLPPELRLCIYNHLYESYSSHPCTFNILRTGLIQTFSLPTFKWGGAASLLRTCKQINQEATPILYAKANFNMSIFHPIPARFRSMVDYGHICDCLTFKNIQHLTISLHVNCEDREMATTLRHLASALDLLDTEKTLKTCSVRLILYWNPDQHDARVALDVVRWILALEEDQRRKLSLVECQIYTQLWKEAMRVSSRISFEYDSSKMFRQYLKAVHAGEERQIGTTERPYDVRPRKIA